MQKLLITIFLFFCALRLNAQTNGSSGDLFNGLTKKITYDKVIPPYGLEVTFDKTVHIIFPAAVRYVDLGSTKIIAGKAEGAENVIRIKAAVRNFEDETNFSVITDDGNFYSFNVRYVQEPEKLNIEMKELITKAAPGKTQTGAGDVYLKELGKEPPAAVNLIMNNIYKKDKSDIKNISSKKYGVEFSIKGIYTNNGMLYFHSQIKNITNIPFDIDFITFKIVDRRVTKRTAVQEQLLTPLRVLNNNQTIRGKSVARSVFTLEKFTIADNKMLVIEIFEKNGGRHQSVMITNRNIVKAKLITNYNTK
ncbi:MAG: conjugative transposon protein TraN [Bacteroidetes bacterium GWF2_40_14]|nr:MAG: conjugative transposon protein TraN [Bacteroidetes bacterium GWF2_40_14]